MRNRNIEFAKTEGLILNQITMKLKELMSIGKHGKLCITKIAKKTMMYNYQTFGR